jgi:hypothetical protein
VQQQHHSDGKQHQHPGGEQQQHLHQWYAVDSIKSSSANTMQTTPDTCIAAPTSWRAAPTTCRAYHMESSNAGSGMSWTAPAVVTYCSSQKSQPTQVRRVSHMEKSSSIPTESDSTPTGEQSATCS